MGRTAILGHPGAGKTTYARKLAKKTGATLVDNIPQKFMKRTGLSLGMPSDFRVEIMLLAERMEAMFKYWDEDVIFTTTVLDSLVYQNIRKEIFLNDESIREDMDFDKKAQEVYDTTSLFLNVFFESFHFNKIVHLDTNIPDGDLYKQLVRFSIKDIIDMFLEGENIETITTPTPTPRVSRNKVARSSE